MVTKCAGELLQAAGFLPERLRLAVLGLPEGMQREIEEIRLRAERPMTVVLPEGEVPTGEIVGTDDLELTVESASQASAYSVVNQIKQGFVHVKGGHRLGLCGTCVVKNGEVTNLHRLSSLAFRIAREVPGIALPVLERLQRDGGLENTLVISPPGKGKTTLLRDLIRSVSDGKGTAPRRVGVADERGELAAMFGGRPQMDIGLRTDVIDGCTKAEAIFMLLRGMNPQVIAVDEITLPEDVNAIKTAVGCGVTLFATAHAGEIKDLEKRALYRTLLEERIFKNVVTVRAENGRRRYDVKTLEGERCSG